MPRFVVRYFKEEVLDVEAEDFRSAFSTGKPLGQVVGVRERHAPLEKEHFVLDHCAVCAEPMFASEEQSDSMIEIKPSNYDQLQRLSEIPLFGSFVCLSCFLKSGHLGCE